MNARPASDITLVLLAVAVAVAVMALAGAAAYAIDVENVTLTDSVVGLLSTVLGAVIGALGTYLGLARGKEEPDSQLSAPQPAPALEPPPPESTQD